MRKGSITLYLSLILGVLLTLICAGLFSVRRAAGRVVLASAAEQGMFSLFSRYDRTLFDKYGILAIDGGYSKEQLKLSALQTEAEEVVEFLLGDSGDLLGPSNLTHLTAERGEVTGYTLLTDQEGALFRQQILRAASGKKTASVMQDLKGQMNVHSSEWEQLEMQRKSIDVEADLQEYDNLKEGVRNNETMEASGDLSAADLRQIADAVFCVQENSQAQDETTAPAVLPENENPIELIRGLQKLGIMNLVIPKGRQVSQCSMVENCVTKRELQQGMGILPQEENSIVDKVLLGEYILDSFTDFTTAKEEASGAVQYQVEYAIGRKPTDVENLKLVLNRLLAVREASNYLYLLQDPEKQEEVQAAALTVSTMIGLPMAEPVVAEVLRLCWAFGESVLDLRELLGGGKIPLIKDASSWQLSLNMLTHIQEESLEQHGSENGLDYKWYLRLLLATQGEEKLTGAVMDLVEDEIRHTEGKEGFRLDNCLVGMKICFQAKQDHLYGMKAERSYDYMQ